MKITKLKPITRMLILFAAFAFAITSWAGNNDPLHVEGYQAAINVNDFLSEPGAVLVQFEAEGGVAHLGKMTSYSDDQRADLVTGELTATVTFEDANGDLLVVSSIGTTTGPLPDGRITFNGTFTVTGGTGRFSDASGEMTFDGWARITDFTAFTGIGFFTFEGDLYGIDVKPDAAFKTEETGTATFDGVNFVYTGSGKASHFGKFTDIVQTELEPFDGAFNGAFMGIVDGRVVLISSFVNEWTHPSGTKLWSSGIEFVSFAMTPEGGPDFTQVNYAEVYQTIEGGTRRFEGAQGVSFGTGVFVPTAPLQVSAELSGTGYISLPNK